MRAAYSRAIRARRVGRRKRGWARVAGARHQRFSDPVAALADGVDDGRVAELGPQPAHGLLDRGGERVGGLVPDPLQQFLGGDHPAGAGEQVLQHGELLGAERQPLPGPGRGPAAGVELDVAVVQQRGQRLGGAAAEGADPGGQLGEVEGLGQVVVGAQAEAFHPVAEAAGRGQHQDPAR